MNFINSRFFGQSENQNNDYLGTALIVICSALLGIWAVKHTIALRQILLWLGSVLSIIYSYPFFKKNFRTMTFGYWLPIILLGAIFCWIIFHHIFLSQYPSESYLQLRSIWLRSFLAAMLSFGCGLAVVHSPKKIFWLWLGILSSFVPLYFQYLFKVYLVHKIFVPDYDGYIFYGKINGVLVGTLSLAGIGGILMDKLREKNASLRLIQNYSVFFGFIVLLVIYSYIYIFDSRNGTGIAVLLLIFFLVSLLPRIYRYVLQAHNFKVILIFLISITLCVILIGGIFKLQNKFNKGWNGFYEDVSIAVQIDKYPNWINFDLLNYPKREAGDGVYGNTYVRFAWATAGARLIYQNPLGIGTTKRVFGKILDRDFGIPVEGIHPISTHSGLIDLTLAYGIPFAFLLLVMIFWNAYLAIKADAAHKCFILAILTAIVPLYLFGELSTGHAVEILFFLLAIFTSLNIVSVFDLKGAIFYGK